LAQFEPTAADNKNFQGEFGQTIPIAQTSAAAIDVEEGVKVLSTPHESFLGMSFESSTAAKDYCNTFACHAGFSIRVDTSRESKKDSMKSKYIFVCQKAGVNKKLKRTRMGP
jgi:hypothetical protein